MCMSRLHHLPAQFSEGVSVAWQKLHLTVCLASAVLQATLALCAHCLNALVNIDYMNVIWVVQDSLRASYHYVPPEDRVSTQRSPMTMRRGRPGRSGRGPRGAGNAPDLPSLLLDGRIVYIGMPIVPSVAELVVRLAPACTSPALL